MDLGDVMNEKTRYLKGLVKEVHIENFKCFEKFTIKGLNRINIFYGDNDSGKTALLEAIYTAFSNTNPTNVFLLLRGFPFGIVEGSTEDSWDLLFFKFNKDGNEKIKLKVVFENGESLETNLSKPFLHKDITVQTQELRQSINPHSLFIGWRYGEAFREAIINIITPQEAQRFAGIQQSIPFTFSTGISVIPYGGLNFTLKPVYFFTSVGKPSTEALTAIYGEIVKENLKDRLLESIKKIKPEVEEIDTINFAGIFSVAVKFKNDNNYYPINAVGEGFSKIFTLVSLLIKNRNGILLIDEIENGLYWKVQPVFWESVEYLVERFNVQLFIATHSYEFLSNVVKLTKNPDNISGFTMIKAKGNIEYLKLTGKDFKKAIEANIEVR